MDDTQRMMQMGGFGMDPTKVVSLISVQIDIKDLTEFCISSMNHASKV